jgi:DNA polymerase III epsilon subunit-like protein
MPYLVFLDTETTGLPKQQKMSALNGADNWPDIVSIAWSVYDNGKLIKSRYSLIKPFGWRIPAESIRIHGITEEKAIAEGNYLDKVLMELRDDLMKSEAVVAHNIEFDKNVIFNAYRWRLDLNPWLIWPSWDICTMARAETELKLPSRYPTTNRPYKSPKLSELYEATLGKKMEGAHNSQKDVEALCEIYWARWG